MPLKPSEHMMIDPLITQLLLHCILGRGCDMRPVVGLAPSLGRVPSLSGTVSSPIPVASELMANRGHVHNQDFYHSALAVSRLCYDKNLGMLALGELRVVFHQCFSSLPKLKTY